MNQLAITNILSCLECEQGHLYKNGVTKNGYQKYKCSQCSKNYTETSYARKSKRQSSKLECPRCSSREWNKVGINRTGKQQYQCKNCDRRFLANPNFTFNKEVVTGVQCPNCEKENIKRSGFNNQRKQQYRCRDCNRVFILNPVQESSKNVLPENIKPDEMFEYDIWDARILGLKATISSGHYSLSFTSIKLVWLKEATKKWIRYKAATGEKTGTLASKIRTVSFFDRFLNSYYPNLKVEKIDRKIVEEYFAYGISPNLESSTRRHRMSFLKQFFEECARFGWANITKQQLIYPSDYPKNKKSLPKFISDHVIKQLEDNLQFLPEPIICMIKVLRETGVRASELKETKFNCIRQDKEGSWWIDIYQEKMDKPICLCISQELAKVIGNQQNYIKDNLGKKFNYLFCQTELHSWFDAYGSSEQKFYKPKELNYFKPIKQKIKYTTLRGYLRQLASEKNITDIDGSIFPLGKIHRFRHTHGTELINAGVPQHIVQKRLGHASPEMTSVYAHIHDKTMRKEMEEFWDGRVLNNQGQVIVSENPDLDTAGMQWIKRNMKAQTLPDGFCGLPVTQSCPVQGSPCLTCSHLRTTINFLDVHKKRLEETEKLIENARANGWDRQVETNLPIAKNLKKIIRGLEQKEVIYGDEKFSEQEGGKQSA